MRHLAEPVLAFLVWLPIFVDRPEAWVRPAFVEPDKSPIVVPAKYLAFVEPDKNLTAVLPEYLAVVVQDKNLIAELPEYLAVVVLDKNLIAELLEYLAFVALGKNQTVAQPEFQELEVACQAFVAARPKRVFLMKFAVVAFFLECSFHNLPATVP